MNGSGKSPRNRDDLATDEEYPPDLRPPAVCPLTEYTNSPRVLALPLQRDLNIALLQ